MIDLYTWTTPNGRKVSIALEEMGVPYEVHAVDINNGEQFRPEFLAISPNNRIPAIVERDTGFQLMESGAILMWLAEREGKFMPEASRWQVIEWLMWQMGGVGPMLGQLHHFRKLPEERKVPYGETRYRKEADRLYGVLDKRLAERDYVAGDYSIADMAIFPWIARYQVQGIDLADHPNVLAWYRRIAARPAVQRGYAQPKPEDIPLPSS